LDERVGEHFGDRGAVGGPEESGSGSHARGETGKEGQGQGGAKERDGCDGGEAEQIRADHDTGFCGSVGEDASCEKGDEAACGFGAEYESDLVVLVAGEEHSHERDGKDAIADCAEKLAEPEPPETRVREGGEYPGFVVASGTHGLVSPFARGREVARICSKGGARGLL